MKQAFAISFFLCVFVFSIFPFFRLLQDSQTIAADAPIAYEMPYPGILPDNPLYLFKVSRDRILDFFTRDNIKKARLYLLYSDKRMVMAQELTKKGKTNLALSTLTKGETYFTYIPELLRNSKKQGVTAPDELILKLKLSNSKHREIMDEIERDLPQGEPATLKSQIDMNTRMKKELEKF